MQAVKFKDLKEKCFVSSCSTNIAGVPRKTKHNDIIPRPQVAEEYLKNANGIDVHNKVRTGGYGGSGLEDTWHTKNPCHRQIAGILGFCFTNAYLSIKYFNAKTYPSGKLHGQHSQFKICLTKQMVEFEEDQENSFIGSRLLTTPKRKSSESMLPEYETSSAMRMHIDHNLLQFSRQRYQKKCFYCQHGREVRKVIKTAYYCSCAGSDRPICSPTTKRDCFNQHIKCGFPPKKYRRNNSGGVAKQKLSYQREMNMEILQTIYFLRLADNQTNLRFLIMFLCSNF